MSRVELDGLALNVERAGEGPPLVLLHGFTGDAGGWSALAAQLAPEFTTLAMEIVGHGASDAPAAPERYRMRRAVDDLVALLRACGHERAAWLGYSMGGRVALQVAVHRSEAVSALVLEGASPGLADAAERARRVASDEALAQRIERDGVPAFVDEWEAQPLFATQAALPTATRAAIRAGRLANRATGLANSLRGMGAGAQEPLHGRLGAVRVPALLLAGALDARYTAIAREMAQALPDATMQVIEGAGHAAHVERPREFGERVLAFLRQVYGAHRAARASAER
ncbi:MAG: 2-succinyl-6-hydroxy-2,4-cyclohexadiene-1-carboxylate synthase [Dehalococcoidia bacterium]|nr:2-succinyl-6-hydroxy-2,4-cyclohexadiene-1-carboxylate synthase [Dehalococcoidia bacterium]